MSSLANGRRRATAFTHTVDQQNSTTWEKGGSSGQGVEETEANEGRLANQRNAGCGVSDPNRSLGRLSLGNPRPPHLRLAFESCLPSSFDGFHTSRSGFPTQALTRRTRLGYVTLAWAPSRPADWCATETGGGDGRGTAERKSDAGHRRETQVLSVAPKSAPAIHARVRAIPSKLSSATADHLAQQRLMVMKCTLNQGQNLAAGQREHEHWLDGMGE